MKLFKLTNLGTRPLYDVAEGFVVAAKNEEEARGIAAENCGDEGRFRWLEAKGSSCEVIGTAVKGAHGLFLRDYCGG